MGDDQPALSPLPVTASRERRRERRRFARSIALGALAAMLLVAALWWPTLVAQARALVVLASVLEVPVLDDVTGALTREPRIDDDVELAGVPATVFRPGGDGPWPAVLFLTGADDAGRRQQDVVRLGQGLARAGFVVVVPDLPGMRDGRVGPDTLDVGRDVVLAAAELDDVRDGEVALASVSAGASIALLLAADERVEPHVSVVAGVAPYAHARTALEVATTDAVVLEDGVEQPFESTQWMQTAIARSLFADSDGTPAAERIEERALEAERPIDHVQQLSADEPALASSPTLALLRATEADEFAARYEALPTDVRDVLEELSPIEVVEGLDAPILLASAPKDKYFPLRESEAIVAAAPDARLTVTSVFEHAIPEASLDELGGIAAFDAYVVRVLREAASG